MNGDLGADGYADDADGADERGFLRLTLGCHAMRHLRCHAMTHLRCHAVTHLRCHTVTHLRCLIRPHPYVSSHAIRASALRIRVHPSHPRHPRIHPSANPSFNHSLNTPSYLLLISFTISITPLVSTLSSSGSMTNGGIR